MHPDLYPRRRITGVFHAAEKPAVKVILRVGAALAVLSVALLSILFVLGVVSSEHFKEATMKLLGVGAITIASLMVVGLLLRKQQ
jgi:CHASE1-domain containing sensor protein